MKRLLSLFLIMAMLLSFTVGANAQDLEISEDYGSVAGLESEAEAYDLSEAETFELTEFTDVDESAITEAGINLKVDAETEDETKPENGTETEGGSEPEEPSSITLEIASIADQLYTGKEIQPDLEVTALVGEEQVALTYETDYTVSYENNIKPGTATVVVTGIADYEGASCEASFTIKSNAQVTYRSYLKKSGYQAWKKNGKASGGSSKPILGFKVKVEKSGYSGSIQYRSNINGWQAWKKDGSLSGTTKSSKKLQAIQIKLTGELAEYFDVYYRVAVPKFGTLGWAKNGQTAGTIGYGSTIKTIYIRLCEKNSKDAPKQSKRALISKNSIGKLTYRVSLENGKWNSKTKNGKIAGSAGKGKKIEAFKASITTGKKGNLTGLFTGSVKYSGYIQGKGWSKKKSDNAVLGKLKSKKRIEAIKISLTGELKEYCDIYYRTYVEKYGWLGWAKNGQAAGTKTIGFRMEAVQIKIVPKGSKAPGSTKSHLLKKVTKPRYINAIDKVVTGGGGTLRGSYYWVVNHLTYERIYEPFPSISGYTQEESYAIHGIEKRTGNCYCFASAFAGAAKRLGYDAKLVKGRVRLQSGRICDHGWVEIRIDGKTYICDPEQDYEHHLGLYLTTYSKAALKYYK